MDRSEGIRIQLYLSQAGVASRRKSEELILKGRVTINGQAVTQLGSKVAEGDRVAVDGREVHPTKQYVYFMLHKPPHYLCSSSDPEGRPLAVSLINQTFQGRLFNVGRLDYLSSGLIFFTNDGVFAKIVAHPSSAIEKEYLVETKKPIPETLLEEFKHGIWVEGERFALKRYELQGQRSVKIVLQEGKNRELRKVFHSRKISVKRVHRVRIGPVSIKGLAPGHYRKLTEREIRWFLDLNKERKGGSSD